MSDFARRLKQLRTDHKLTQKELSEKLNVTQNAIFNWENRKREPSANMIEKIAALFEVPPAYLMGWKDASEDISYTFPTDSFWDERLKLLNFFDLLNYSGKIEAVKRIQELTEIKKYTE